MEDPTPVKIRDRDENSCDNNLMVDSDIQILTTNTEVSIASEFNYDPTKYTTTSLASNTFQT